MCFASIQGGIMSAPVLHGSFTGNSAVFKSANGSRTSMASATSIVKKAQKAAKSAARKVGYKKSGGASWPWKAARKGMSTYSCLLQRCSTM